MILICGGLADSVTELMCARLEDCGYPYRFLDLATYPAGFEVNWGWKAGYPDGHIACKDWRLDLDEISSVYVRYLGPEGRIPSADISQSVAPSLYAEHDTGLAALFENLPCMVVNRLGGGMSNHSKPYQALMVRDADLLTPPTLVTNDPEAARRFYEEHNGQVIYKSMSGIRSIVHRMGSEQLARLPFLRHAPAQFQAFIPGDNVRVHTIGDEVIATRVHSDAVDYRYARREGHNVEMELATLPKPVEAACLRLASRLDLLLTGIDLKETPGGDYYCFEINPSPGFMFYEQCSGQPISRALADLLHYGSSFVSEVNQKEDADEINNAFISNP
jgi:glutathione synthase/RimK-type ligase-like ATP-grasp enzyme